MATDYQWYNPMSMVRSASNVANQQFNTEADIHRQRIAMDRLIAELPYRQLSQAHQQEQSNIDWARQPGNLTARELAEMESGNRHFELQRLTAAAEAAARQRQAERDAFMHQQTMRHYDVTEKQGAANNLIDAFKHGGVSASDLQQALGVNPTPPPNLYSAIDRGYQTDPSGNPLPGTTVQEIQEGPVKVGVSAANLMGLPGDVLPPTDPGLLAAQAGIRQQFPNDPAAAMSAQKALANTRTQKRYGKLQGGTAGKQFLRQMLFNRNAPFRPAGRLYDYLAPIINEQVLGGGRGIQ